MILMNLKKMNDLFANRKLYIITESKRIFVQITVIVQWFSSKNVSMDIFVKGRKKQNEICGEHIHKEIIYHGCMAECNICHGFIHGQKITV
jgi:hypothetical protein